MRISWDARTHQRRLERLIWKGKLGAAASVLFALGVAVALFATIAVALFIASSVVDALARVVMG